jgi:hypothetical protein
MNTISRGSGLGSQGEAQEKGNGKREAGSGKRETGDGALNLEGRAGKGKAEEQQLRTGERGQVH